MQMQTHDWKQYCRPENSKNQAGEQRNKNPIHHPSHERVKRHMQQLSDLPAICVLHLEISSLSLQISHPFFLHVQSFPSFVLLPKILCMQ